MLRHLFFSSVLVMIGTATSGQSQVSAEANPIVVTGKTAKENKRVCKSSVATGSIMPKKVCRKQSEWDEQRDRDLVALERISKDREARQHAQELRDVQ